MKSISDLHHDFNGRIDSIQDQVSDLQRKPATFKDVNLEHKVQRVSDRIEFLEEKIDGQNNLIVKRDPETSSTMIKNVRKDMLNHVDDNVKQLLSKHEEIEESKVGLERRIKQLEKQFAYMDEEQSKINQDLRDDIEGLVGVSDPKQQTRELEKRIQMINQRHEKDIQEIQDDILKNKYENESKQRSAKVDKVQAQIYELQKRVDIHDDDISETARIIQALDKDRIQDGKTTQTLKKEYEIVEERLDNMAEAILEINTALNKIAKSNVDYGDLNIIKEACLEDFNTINQRISDVCDVFDQLSNQVSKNEKEIEALKVLKTPKINVVRKDIASPLRSSMSQHLGSNLRDKRSYSQAELHRAEQTIQQDTYLKVQDFRNIQERDSVLSNSRINKYLGESFDENDVTNYNTNPNRIIAYDESSPSKHREIPSYKTPVANDQIVVEDVDSDLDDIDDKNKQQDSMFKHHQSSKQSDYTFKADEIFKSSRENSFQKPQNKAHFQSHHSNQNEKQEDFKNASFAPAKSRNANYHSEHKHETDIYDYRKPKNDSNSAHSRNANRFSSGGSKHSALQPKKNLPDDWASGNNEPIVSKPPKNIWGPKDTIKVSQLEKVSDGWATGKEDPMQPSNIWGQKDAIRARQIEEQKVQLGPVTGHTLDGESSEGEYESDFSIEDPNVQKIANVGYNSPPQEQIIAHSKKNVDPGSDWDYEESDGPKIGNENQQYQHYNPRKPAKDNKNNMKMDDLDLDGLID